MCESDAAPPYQHNDLLGEPSGPIGIELTDNERNLLRRQLRKRRERLTRAERDSASFRMAQLISSARFFKAAGYVAFYLPLGSEINDVPLMLRALAQRKAVYLPVVLDMTARRMAFVRYTPGMPLEKNGFGILEPVPDSPEVADPRMLDLVVTPLLGFDSHGNRLGMGAGYYDRAFRFMRYRNAWTKPKLVGVAYECQQVDRIEGQPWDIPLWRIVTEKQIIKPVAEKSQTHSKRSRQ